MWVRPHERADPVSPGRGPGTNHPLLQGPGSRVQEAAPMLSGRMEKISQEKVFSQKEMRRGKRHKDAASVHVEGGWAGRGLGLGHTVPVQTAASDTDTALRRDGSTCPTRNPIPAHHFQKRRPGLREAAGS